MFVGAWGFLESDNSGDEESDSEDAESDFSPEGSASSGSDVEVFCCLLWSSQRLILQDDYESESSEESDEDADDDDEDEAESEDDWDSLAKKAAAGKSADWWQEFYGIVIITN